MQDVEG